MEPMKLTKLIKGHSSIGSLLMLAHQSYLNIRNPRYTFMVTFTFPSNIHHSISIPLNLFIQPTTSNPHNPIHPSLKRSHPHPSHHTCSHYQ